jgi:hypothetical protein
VRSRYRRSLCLPTSCLSVCPAYETRVGVGDRRSLVFACAGVWIDLILLKLPPTSWCLPATYLDWANNGRGHVQEIPPRPVPRPPCICTSICIFLPPSPPFFHSTTQCIQPTLSTTAVSGTPLSCTAAQQHRATRICSLSNEKLSIWILGITSPIRLACHSSSRHSCFPPAAGRSSDPTNPSALPIAVAHHRTPPPLT